MSSIGSDVRVGKLQVLESISFDDGTSLTATNVYIQDKLTLGPNIVVQGLDDTYCTDAELANVADRVTVLENNESTSANNAVGSANSAAGYASTASSAAAAALSSANNAAASANSAAVSALAAAASANAASSSDSNAASSASTALGLKTAAENAAANAAASANLAQVDFTAITNDIASNAARITVVESELSNVSANVGLLQSNVSNLNFDVYDSGGLVSNLSSNLSNIESNLAEAFQLYSDAISGNSQATTTLIAAGTTVGAGAVLNVVGKIFGFARQKANQTFAEQTRTTIAEVFGTTSNNWDNISASNGYSLTNNSNITQLQAQTSLMRSHTDTTSVRQVKINGNSSNIASLQSNTANLQASQSNTTTLLSNIQSELFTHDTLLALHSNELADNVLAINSLTSSLSDNSARINTVSGDLASNSGRISTVSGDLASNVSRIQSLENAGSGAVWTTSGNDIHYNSGAVGINTTSPGYKLQVLTNTNWDGISLRDSSRELCKIARSYDGSYLEMFDSGTSTVNISSIGDSWLNGGNVGIGSGAVGSNPKALTHIGKLSANSGTHSTIPSANMGSSASFPDSTNLWLGKRATSSGDDYWGMALGTLYSSGNSYIQTLNKQNSAYYNLLLQPNGGNVGIRKSSPSTPLHVKANATNTLNNGLRLEAYANTNRWDFYLWGTNADNLEIGYNGYTKVYVRQAGSSTALNFTGQHRTFIKDVPFTEADELEGLIVSADNNKFIKMSGGIEAGSNAITTNESLPVVSISTKSKDKKCFGVISASEDPETREEQYGNLVSITKKELGDTRVYINSVGEGAIWVTNINGNLESGDYITTSNVSGYGMLQDDDILHNYTVAKITMDCDFEPVTQPIQTIKKELGNVNYWVETTYTDVELEEYSNLAEENRQTVTTTMFSNEEGDISPGEYSNLESNVQATYSEIETITYQKIDRLETETDTGEGTLEVREELVNVPDADGQLQWEDHPTETEKAYKIRYLTSDGTQTDEANAVHTAAFVGCTYHCG